MSLKWQISLALLLIAGLFVSGLMLNQARFAESLQDQKLLNQAREITQRAVDLERRGRNYKAVAPRTFADYGRDLRVFYGDLQADLERLAQAVDALAMLRPQPGDPRREVIDRLVGQHAAFSAGLWEKIGENREEPRLEWAAEFLAAESGALREAAESTEAAVAEVARRHLQAAAALTRAAWAFAALALVLVLLWFWLRVTRRIGRAARQCRQVAEGEFGTRILDASDDEIGAFGQGFIALSSRTRVVLGVIDQLPSDATPERAFETLWQESRPYLGHQWQALFALDADEQTGTLRACEQEASVPMGAVGEAYALAGVLAMVSARGDALLIEDVRRHTLEQSQARLLRALSRSNLRTLALVVLRDEQRRARSLLAFAWPEARAEDAGVARFLAGLARFLTRTLVDSKPSRAPLHPA